jgi:hypothetical protein
MFGILSSEQQRRICESGRRKQDMCRRKFAGCFHGLTRQRYDDCSIIDAVAGDQLLNCLADWAPTLPVGFVATDQSSLRDHFLDDGSDSPDGYPGICTAMLSSYGLLQVFIS